MQPTMRWSFWRLCHGCHWFPTVFRRAVWPDFQLLFKVETRLRAQQSLFQIPLPVRCSCRHFGGLQSGSGLRYPTCAGGVDVLARQGPSSNSPKTGIPRDLNRGSWWVAADTHWPHYGKQMCVHDSALACKERCYTTNAKKEEIFSDML